ncbi:MAG: tetratricopeptide repeat protein, partial [Isosphaeraceae bacterium]
ADRAADLLGPLADSQSRRQVEDLCEEVRRRADAARHDAELLGRAQYLRLRRMENLDDTVADASYASAFRAAGLDVDALGPEAAGARIRSRPPRVALALAAVLDDWSARRRSIHGKDDADWKRLVAAAGAADPDATRNRLRELWSLPDPKAQRTAMLELARQADPRKWPTTTVTRLAWSLAIAGENAAAIDLLRRTDLAQPGDVWVNFHLGRLLAESRPPRLDEAVAHLSAARALQPETGHDLAILLLRLGRFDQAKAILEQLVRLRPEAVGQWFDLARMLREHGDRSGAADTLEKGIAAMRQAVLERPDDAERRSDLGRLLAVQGKSDEAIAECRSAVRLWPEAPAAHHFLASVLASSGKHDQAAAECREALRLRPDDANAHGTLAAILLALSKPAEAAAEAREALRIRPALDMGYFQLARALAAQGKRDEAIAAYREAIGLWADFVDARINLGGLLLDAGKLEQALAAYREALRIRPDHPDAHRGLGKVLAAQKKREEAIVEFREALRIQPDSVDAHRNLGLTLEQMGRREAAIAEYREALRIQPRLPDVLVDLGLALTEAGRPAEAVEYFRASLRIRPDNGVTHFDFGVALQALGQVDQAVAEYRQAVRLQPDIAQAHCNLGGILMQQGRYREALDALRKGHELGSRQPDWPYPTAEWIRQAEQSVQLQDRLPAVIRGVDKPKTADEGITLGRMLHGMKRYALAARLFADALAADPRLAENLRAGHRYNAACDAALAADGQGVDPIKDDGAKVRWRKQALDCLRADLAAWTKLIESGNPDAKDAAGRMLDHWKRDSDLTAIRDESALKHLPEAEQKACRALWTEVDARLAAAMRP